MHEQMHGNLFATAIFSEYTVLFIDNTQVK